MERRFEERKREIEEDAKIDKKALAGSVRRLQQFGTPYFEHFRRSETREHAQIFLEGLLSDIAVMTTSCPFQNSVKIGKTNSPEFAVFRFCRRFLCGFAP